jgi:hypothetical protein
VEFDSFRAFADDLALWQICHQKNFRDVAALSFWQRLLSLLLWDANLVKYLRNISKPKTINKISKAKSVKKNPNESAVEQLPTLDHTTSDEYETSRNAGYG